MLLLQKAHTVPQTFNLCRRNPTPARKTQKHSQNASTQKPKRSETVPWTSRLLQKICSLICRHLKSSNTFNKEGCQIQVDPRMSKLFSYPKRISTTGTNTQITRSPSQLHTVHGHLEICIHGRTNPAQWWYRSPHHLH